MLPYPSPGGDMGMQGGPPNPLAAGPDASMAQMPMAPQPSYALGEYQKPTQMTALLLALCQFADSGVDPFAQMPANNAEGPSPTQPMLAALFGPQTTNPF